ncbi:hypothetical protein [Paracoccus sp. TOH]|uniref:hypothetical protein n=1 Tax=Paracoccus sp. TOH TaxID=1263728 RepID=UPI0025B25532|nr:hypothetical protein [Paracoccus sp. TOH]WJS83885.1 hypothetical protein NBE95_08930 [Paracoccus sp. TOH]
MNVNISALRLAPYSELKVEGRNTLALLNSDAQWIIARIGSEAVRVPAGHCYPMPADHVTIVNPYPRAINATVARGLPINFGPENKDGNLFNITSLLSRAAIKDEDTIDQVSQKKGFCVMMKKGRVRIKIYDSATDGSEMVYILSGVPKSFMSHRPAAALNNTFAPIFQDGEYDNTMYAYSGIMHNAALYNWVTAAGYDGFMNATAFMANFDGKEPMEFVVDDRTALFYLCNSPKFKATMEFTHLGLSVEDYD